jgi:hypothetical protein
MTQGIPGQYHGNPTEVESKNGSDSVDVEESRMDTRPISALLSDRVGFF